MDASATASGIPRNKEAIRVLTQDVGYNRASELTGVKAGTLRQWAKRYRWTVTQTQIRAYQSKRSESVTNVTRVGETHSEELASLEKATKLSLAKTVRKHAAEAEKRDLSAAKLVESTVSSASKLYKWNEQSAPTHFSLNMNVLQLDGRATD